MYKSSTSYQTLLEIAVCEQNDSSTKKLTELLLQAMSFWPSNNQYEIFEFIDEIKSYLGNKINNSSLQRNSFDGTNTWQIISASLILEFIEFAGKVYDESNIDRIVTHILNSHEVEN